MSMKTAIITSLTALMNAACSTLPEKQVVHIPELVSITPTPAPAAYVPFKLENPCQTRRPGGLEDKSDGGPRPCMLSENTP